jgi:hypothetical protein
MAGKETHKGEQRIGAHLPRRRRPDRCTHRQQVIVDESRRVAVGIEIVAQRLLFEITAVEKLGGFLVEAQDVAQHTPVAPTDEIGRLADKAAEAGAGIFERAAIDRGAERHVRGVAGDVQMLE